MKKIIPAYNEEECIVQVVDNIIYNYPQYDYVVVNDGSTDSTLDICVQKKYNTINLVHNLGLTKAFQTGMKYALLHDYNYAIPKISIMPIHKWINNKRK